MSAAAIRSPAGSTTRAVGWRRWAISTPDTCRSTADGSSGPRSKCFPAPRPAPTRVTSQTSRWTGTVRPTWSSSIAVSTRGPRPVAPSHRPPSAPTAPPPSPWHSPRSATPTRCTTSLGTVTSRAVRVCPLASRTTRRSSPNPAPSCSIGHARAVTCFAMCHCPARIPNTPWSSHPRSRCWCAPQASPTSPSADSLSRMRPGCARPPRDSSTTTAAITTPAARSKPSPSRPTDPGSPSPVSPR